MSQSTVLPRPLAVFNRLTSKSREGSKGNGEGRGKKRTWREGSGQTGPPKNFDVQPSMITTHLVVFSSSSCSGATLFKQDSIAIAQ